MAHLYFTVTSTIFLKWLETSGKGFLITIPWGSWFWLLTCFLGFFLAFASVGAPVSKMALLMPELGLLEELGLAEPSPLLTQPTYVASLG